MLFSSRIEILAFGAERLSTCSVPQILSLNIIPSIAVCVVVMNRLLDRMPRRFLRYFCSSFDALKVRIKVYHKTYESSAGSSNCAPLINFK